MFKHIGRKGTSLLLAFVICVSVFIGAIGRFPIVTADDSASGGSSRVNITQEFTDANFLAEVRALVGGEGAIYDTDVAKITSLEVSEKNIASLDGIQYFTSLETLDCSYNRLTKLDVSNCPFLRELYCAYNQLTSLNISLCPALEKLACSNNNLTGLDVSSCPELTHLWCGDNQLTALDVGVCTGLSYLDCSGNKLANLDISGCTALKALHCYSNQLTTLNVSNYAELAYLRCSDNLLTKLNVNACPALAYLDCRNNNMQAEFDIIGLNMFTNVSFYPQGSLTPVSPSPAVSPTPEGGFLDVASGDWFYEDVMYATESGLFTGVSIDAFEPATTMTRGMLVTVLYRMSDSPLMVEPESLFSDTPSDKWYFESVYWAAKNGIVTGYGDAFGPNNFMTREQMAAILYRYAKYIGKGPEGDWQIPLDFADVKQISNYAVEGAMFCLANNIISGRTSKIFAPKDETTRAEVAAMLRRFIENVAEKPNFDVPDDLPLDDADDGADGIPADSPEPLPSSSPGTMSSKK
ncbi:MAG: S-layer homology domain-containing protein [Clostridiales bacterium]|jgi:hypothetical protein|nr:S-layer homology domain-containing protein [Clostridiales bacterium]